ncbi:hypothetical protein Tco_0094326, partial [Tanacetum coccineum]
MKNTRKMLPEECVDISCCEETSSLKDEGVLRKSAEKLKPYLMQAVTALGDPSDTYTEIVTSVCGGTTATFPRDDENHSQLS